MNNGANQAIEAYVRSERGPYGDGGARRVVLRLYRLLARGAPVAPAMLARDMGASENHAENMLAALPPSWIERGGARRLWWVGTTARCPPSWKPRNTVTRGQ